MTTTTGGAPAPALVPAAAPLRPGGPLSRLRRIGPRTAVALSLLGTALMMLVGAAAPNDHSLGLRLPLAVLPTMSGHISTLATCAAILLQALGLLALLGAVRDGWRPDPRRLLAVGGAVAAVYSCLTPIGSADTASYAVYGRIAALGGSPYLLTPADLGGDYARLVSSSWMNTPSVYGPVATWIQQASAAVGADRPWLTVWLLMLLNGAAYVGTGLLLVRCARGGRGKVLAAVLWGANPLLIGQLVGGGHLDTYVAALAALAVCVARGDLVPGWVGRVRLDLAVGVLLGVACGIKVSAGLIGAALVWMLVREQAWDRALRMTAAAAATLVALYSCYGTAALAPLAAASQLVSVPSLWQLLRYWGDALVGPDSTASFIGAAWPPVMLALTVLLARRMPRGTPELTAIPFALTLGWLLAAPWVMPWYAGVVWALAALIPRNPHLRVLIALTAFLSLVHNTGGHGWSW